MIRGAVLIGVLAGCSGKGPVRTGGEAGTERDAAIGNVVPAPDARRCPGVAEDVAAREPGAEPDEPLDVDGDGTPDPVFRDCGGARNCDYLIYVERDGCARYLGAVVGAPYAHPYCVDPGTADRPCRISINHHMIHGDAQQYFYEVVDGAYAEVGAGEHFEGPKKRR